jgi:molybdopterin converting factor subunit 1
MKMRIRVLLFASLRERAGGVKQIEIYLDNKATVSALKEQIAVEYAALKPSMKSVLVTINRDYASDETRISEGAEIALFPPVSGG